MWRASILFSGERARSSHPPRMPSHHLQGEYLGLGAAHRRQIECGLANAGGKVLRHGAVAR
jgi:hypothetical protein